MSRNVWEWCQDWYGEYPDGPETDPPGPASGTYRVMCGGSFGYVAHFQRSANRDRSREDSSSRGYGFLLVLPSGQ